MQTDALGPVSSPTPALKFASLGSGSSGNATLISCGDVGLMIDCGFSCREAERRLLDLKFSPEHLAAIFVTHEHGDHMRGVSVLAGKWGIPVYASAGTGSALRLKDDCELRLLRAGVPVQVAGFDVQPIAVPHDAREPLQFVVSRGNLRIGVLTDLGSLNESVIDAYHGCHGLLLEANHDLALLAQGPYPPVLRRRVGGSFGHLNNEQTLQLLQLLDLRLLQKLIIGHISQKNNELELIKRTLAPVVDVLPHVLFAEQDSGSGWMELVQV